MSIPYASPQRAGHAPASSSQQSFAPRSASLPLSMGHSQSKPVPPLPSSPATKGFNAAVAGGIKLKRAFAGRRKKSEDAKEQPTVAPRIESSVSAPPQYINRSTVVSPASLPPIPPTKESPPLEPTSGGSRNSVMVISPGISSAVNYISLMDQQKQEVDKDKERENSKENWRKSDSTNSHHTIRPGGGAAKSSRPVSWAESFQSTHTVVQTSNRRLSALIGDADFGMPEAEEDDDDEANSHPPHQRSASQGMPVGSQPFPLPPSPPPSAPATSLKYPSHSISEGFSIHHRPPRLTTPSASQPPPQNLRGRTLYISPPVSTTASQQERGQTQQQALLHHPSSAFYSSSPPISSTSSASASFRQTAISMTSGGIGPAAAGLAKRAVEKMSMGKKWAMGMGMSSSSSAASGSGSSSLTSGSSSHTGSTGGPSSFTSAHTDYGLVSMGSKESMSGVHKHHLHGVGHRRTPGHGSGATSTSAAGSISSSSITSSSDASSSDPFAQSSGPMLGRKLRGGLLTKNGVKVAGGGVVFGRSLAVGVRETGVFVGKALETQVEEHPKEGLVRELEERMLPAVVVRCAQHILLWGVQEEGLFRVSGRPTHVSKLRAEFDSGADYDMTESTPGDLDPHAVASVFKAYLRELPEPILSHKLSPLFDAAVNKETTINADAFVGGGGSGGMRLGARPGLPNSPKSGFAIRKPPSLSTLAMPTFTAIPPPSSALILSIRTLISQLPQENRDLLRTVVDLIRATARRSKETKMPLSNLLLVFCPSLSMTPPLLKVLCEAEGIWGGVYGDDEDGKEGEKEVGSVIDIRRQTMPARSPTATKDSGGFFGDEPTATAEESESLRSGRASLDTTDNNPSSDYHASAEEESIYDDEYEMLGEVAPRRRIQREGMAERREEVPTVYLDCSSRSASSLGCQEDLAGSLSEEMSMSLPYLQHSREPARDDDGSISSGNYSMHAPSPPPLLSSSSDSVATPISSGNPSFSNLPLEHEQHQEKDQPQIHAKDHQHQRHEGSGLEIVDVTPLELRLPPPQTQTQTQTQTSKRPVISSPIPIPVQFPTTPPPPATPQQRSGGTATALKRRSIPMLSLPNFSSALPSASKKEKEKDSPSPTPSLLGSPSSGGGVGPAENLKSLKRSKKPSLKLLFSKRSASSLTGTGTGTVGERDRSNSVGCGGMPFISAPIPHAASMVSLSPQWSPKHQHQHQQEQRQTPPSSAASDSNSSVSTPISAVTAPQSQAASLRSLPPVLDTPIEGASFGFDIGFGMGLTPAPANAGSSTSTDAPLNNSRSHTPPPLNLPVIHPLSFTHRTTTARAMKSGGNYSHIRSQASSSNLSIASTASSNHLSLFEDEDDDEGMEEWTQSVLLAADVDVEAVQKAP